MSSQTVDVLVNGARGSRRRGAGTCKGCGLAIWWCATAKNQRPIPFDEVPEVDELHGDVETVSTKKCHWNTCEKRDQFKKPKPDPVPPAPVGTAEPTLFE